jgi:hypothetical protein
VERSIAIAKEASPALVSDIEELARSRDVACSGATAAAGSASRRTCRPSGSLAHWADRNNRRPVGFAPRAAAPARSASPATRSPRRGCSKLPGSLAGARPRRSSPTTSSAPSRGRSRSHHQGRTEVGAFG